METQTPPPEVRKRNPWAAGALSYLLCGLGQVYNGDILKGIIFLIAEVYLGRWLVYMILGRPTVNSFLLITGLLALLKIYCIIDASVCAARKKEYIPQVFNRWYVYTLSFMIVIVIQMAWGVFMGRTFYSSYNIPTGSMRETIMVNDYIIEDRTAYGLHYPFSNKYIFMNKAPERNDIIIFLQEDISYIKRCIGQPGDVVEIVEREVFVNNILQPPPEDAHFLSYVVPKDHPNPRIFPRGSGWNDDNYGPIRVPKAGDTLRFNDIEAWKDFIREDSGTGLHSIHSAAQNKYHVVKKNYLFVMGDSRNNSLDSRYIGFIPVEKVTGKASWIYFSVDPETYELRGERLGLKLK